MDHTTTAPNRQPNPASDQREVALLLDLLEAVVDPEPCRLVEGSCFSHHFFDIDPSGQCPMADAKAVLDTAGANR